MGLLATFRQMCGMGARASAFSGPDRRVSPRYDGVPNCATLVWRGEHGEVSVIVHVMNVSVNGIMLEAPIRPPMGQEVWIRLDLPHPTEWYPAVVTRLTGTSGCALVFPGSCPYELYKAMRGIRNVEREQTKYAEEFDERYWK